jgi:hypothetical protein
MLIIQYKLFYLFLLVYNMEEDPEINFPEPIQIRRIHEKIDIFSEKNIIRKWGGYDIIDTLFYLYLFNKYKNNCLVKYMGVISNNSLGVELQIKQRIVQSDKIRYKKHLTEVSKQISECIRRKPDSIVIPLYLKTSKGGHANILIYRKKNNVIEHFEPHGAQYSRTDIKTNNLINLKLDEFIDTLNATLKKDNILPVTIIRSNDVCPFIDGFQNLEGRSTMPKLKLEGGGYCAAWSMFFTELALKNPTISSNQLLNIIYNKLEKDTQSNYLRRVIIGYVNLIYDKIEKYFSFITGSKLTVSDIDKLLETGKSDDFILEYNTIINIETELLNNPSLTKEAYLDILEEKKQQIKEPINNIKRIELTNLNKQIDVLRRMDLLLNPSPISGKEVKIKSESPISPKNITKKKKTSMIYPLKFEDGIVVKVSSQKTKKFARCPEGKERNPVTKRCKKKRELKLKSSTQKTQKNTPCPEGKKINPESGRCKKIKIYPPCTEGKIRGPITNRCKKHK